MSALNHYDRN